jgi:hypothetical protein
MPRKACSTPSCNRPQWSLGFCGHCVQRLRTEQPEEAARLTAMTPAERAHANYMTKNSLPLPKWEWEGNEAELIRICDQNSRHHVKVGFRTTAPRTELETENG